MTPALEIAPWPRSSGRRFAGDANARRAVRGVLYAGLMLTAEGPKLIEYNVRFGDPETQAMVMRLDSDLLDLLLATAEGRSQRVCAAALEDGRGAHRRHGGGGVSGRIPQGGVISGVGRANALPGVKVFHAGTALRGGTLVAAGGRVLNVTARGRPFARRRCGRTRRSTHRLAGGVLPRATRLASGLADNSFANSAGSRVSRAMLRPR